MNFRHKNKAFTTFLALVLGGVGVHRFYLRGLQDTWGWLHFSGLMLSGLAIRTWPEQPIMFTAGPLVISILAGFIEALVLGLTPDDKWDHTYNPYSGKQSRSSGLLAVVLVLTVGIGAVAFIAVLSRMLDLLFTGGAYG
jgi:hypothetical protein